MKSDFWSRYPGLVWSNSAAEDEVYLRAALLKPRFQTLLDLAVEFGLERLRSEWQVLTEEGRPEAVRAAKHLERILRHLEIGFSHAAT